LSQRSLELKQRLAAGATALGAWLTITDPVVAEIMAGAGFDYVLIDTEHAPWSLESLQTAMLAFRGMPTVPIVRVPWNDPVHVKQALDLGADGVLAPMVRSAAEARSLVAAAKCPPEGIRGFGPRRASDYGRDIDAYVVGANAETIVIPQIEDVGAAEAIEEILAVPGVDALCIGPNDLSGSAGALRHHDHPAVRGAIDNILRVASAGGVAVCTGITLPLERQADWIERGARLALLTSDIELLAGGAAGILAAARAKLG
jgi:2-keto-3-deoxy-L-rhamnonate aldolase RhmA